AKDEEDYIKSIEYLYRDKYLRNNLSKKAKRHAKSFFSVDKMVDKWEKVFKEILNLPKTRKKWNIIKYGNKISNADVFLESLGIYGKVFNSYRNAKSIFQKNKAIKLIKKLNESLIWKSSSKGTVHHYNHFFPKDRYLSIWSKIMHRD
ncbi:MAG: hypothetical protein ABIC36_00960, partial [bacterium]